VRIEQRDQERFIHDGEPMLAGKDGQRQFVEHSQQHSISEGARALVDRSLLEWAVLAGTVAGLDEEDWIANEGSNPVAPDLSNTLKLRAVVRSFSLVATEGAGIVEPAILCGVMGAANSSCRS
jgi:hypothetical protein